MISRARSHPSRHAGPGRRTDTRTSYVSLSQRARGIDRQTGEASEAARKRALRKQSF